MRYSTFLPTPGGHVPCARRLLRIALIWMMLWTVTSTTSAEESRVLLVYPEVPSPLLGEALVHVRGELGSLGLSIQVTTTAAEEQDVKPELLPGTYGALVFEERPGALILRAYHPGSLEPTTQQLSTQDGRITPHVVGVRAVETLRAALQQYYYSTHEPVPEPVKRLARVEDPPPPPPPRPPPPAPLPPAPAPPPPSPPERHSGLALDLWLAPMLQWDVLNARAAGAASVGLGLGRDWWAVGAELESTWIPFELRAESGSAQVHRHAAAVELQSRLRLTRGFGVFARLGGGLLAYRMKGAAVPGYDANDDSHWTAFGAAGVGADCWFNSRFGMFLEGEASVALDAPYVRFTGVPSERFERPLLSFALGVMFGLVR
ncbi:MAG TPA: hypothetical protein VFU02_24565 [Polyangiaceae bacterium]|nr:hypothetical protein [Polyangiaceae bacterium]